jgi:hypothetical protein
MRELKFTTYPYGIRPEPERLPADLNPMESAPVTSNTPVRVYQANGESFPALFYRDQWHRVESRWDPYAGRMREQMSGRTAVQPVGWKSS